MITFACAACQKKLSVNDQLARKKGKCPRCGQAVAVPANLPRLNKRTNARTHPPSSGLDATQGGGKPDGGFDSSLTDFLASPQADDELGRLGQYRILKVLGHGGMGVVFKAEDPKLKRSVAIKAMLPRLAASPRAGQRFLREAQAMASVKHDHVATIYQVDEEGGVPFLAMEFLVGETLDARLEGDPSLPLDEVLRIGREIAEGLQAAHASGLIHRDVKPANIWLEAPRSRVKILDFGLARATTQAVERTHHGPLQGAELTHRGAVIGTPAYMAPEQARGEVVDARGDLFSLGVVLYRLCTGQQPFRGNSTVAVLMEVTLCQPPPPCQLNGSLPQELSDLVMRLLEKEADRRPGSAAEVVEILHGLERKPVPASPEVKPESATEVWEEIVDTEQVSVPAVLARRSRAPLAFALCLLAAVPLVWWLAGVLFRDEAANGTLIVEMNDNETEAGIRNGKVVLTGPDNKVRYTLEPGERNKELAAGRYKVRVTGAVGLVPDPAEFTLIQGNRVTVRVTATPVADIPIPTPIGKTVDPERLAAKYVLSVGGSVRVNDRDRDVTVAADLPRTPFQLTRVALPNNKEVDDAGLAHFAGCRYLKFLDLGQTQVTDLGLANFEDCKNLEVLWLYNTRLTDAGLAHLKDCKNMKHLHLQGSQVGAAGLDFVKNFTELTVLDLGNTKVTDAGLANLKGCKKLTLLFLWANGVGDAGVVHLKGFSALTYLDLGGTKVTDAGLAHFAGVKSLTGLLLWGTRVGDAGFAHFKECKNLQILSLNNTKVTDLSPLKGMALKELNCDFKPARDTTILRSIKTLETVNGKPVNQLWGEVEKLWRPADKWGKAVAALPALEQVKAVEARLKELNPGFDGKVATTVEGGQVTEVRFTTDKVKDISPVRAFIALRALHCAGTHANFTRGNGQLADLGPLKEINLAGLKQLNLGWTRVGDAGLAYLKDARKLVHLHLQGTKVSDRGLAHLKECANLAFLDLGATGIGDAGLVHVKDCENLFHLVLLGSKVGGAGLAHLKGCKKLTHLNLAHTNVGNEGLAHLKGCKSLTILQLEGTKVTDLSPLNSIPLKDLSLEFNPKRDTTILRSMTTLETINGKPAKEFWKEVDARKP